MLSDLPTSSICTWKHFQLNAGRKQGVSFSGLPTPPNPQCRQRRATVSYALSLAGEKEALVICGGESRSSGMGSVQEAPACAACLASDPLMMGIHHPCKGCSCTPLLPSASCWLPHTLITIPRWHKNKLLSS